MALTEQAGPFIQSASTPGVINLGLGQPSPRLLPIARLAEAARTQLHAGTDPLLMQYGAALGHPGFRESLARVLAQEYGQPVAAEELMVTGGNSMALTLVSEVFGRRGGVVVCEDPTYFLACGVFASAGLSVRGVPVDAEGLEVEALERLLAGGLRPAFVYTIPAFHNPCGVCLSPARARRLVELAEAHDFMIVADEPYVLLHYGDERPGSLTRYDEGRGRVLSLGSFSKLLGPGLRLGWAHASPAVIERLAGHGAIRSGGCLNPVVAQLVRPMLDDGSLLAQVDELRSVYGERSRALCQALRERLPGAKFVAPQGGYFCWVELGGDTAALLERAQDLRFLPGRRCAVERELGGFVRLSFSFYEAEELVEGVGRLAGLR
ncbi:MAG: PLP-dependent aminotransferase family protein [Enhygromyxa sp.]